jgi:glycosyl hydrolase family 38
MVWLLSSVSTGPRGTLPSSQSGFKVFRAGVLVTALKQKSKGKVTFMRLWELAGQSGKVALSFGWITPRIARPVDLRGNSQCPPIAVQGSSFEFALRCFASASFANWNRLACGYHCFPVH